MKTLQRSSGKGRSGSVQDVEMPVRVLHVCENDTPILGIFRFRFRKSATRDFSKQIEC